MVRQTTSSSLDYKLPNLLHRFDFETLIMKTMNHDIFSVLEANVVQKGPHPSGGLWNIKSP